MKIACTSKMWKYHGPAAWYFISLPKIISKKLRTTVTNKNAWGSIRVQATIKKTSWSTSIFWDSKSNTYLLPIKADVRKKEQLLDSSKVAISLLV